MEGRRTIVNPFLKIGNIENPLFSDLHDFMYVCFFFELYAIDWAIQIPNVPI